MAGPGVPVTGDDLRGVFRRVPAGVAVVTVDHDGERLGLTVASMVSLSLEPPLVAVSIARQAAMHEILRGAGRFAVTFLAAGDEGARLAAHRADVRNRDECAAVVAAGTAAGLDRIDILVNVVGDIRSRELYKPLLEMDEERWDDTMTLNLKGSFHLLQLVAPGMLERRYGRIVNFSSINFAGEFGQADYGAAKAAVASLTRSLAMELAPDITVNCVAPGTIQTSVMANMPQAYQDKYRNAAVLKRFGEPRDIANAVLFLASDEAAFITGQILTVSGGIWPAL